MLFNIGEDMARWTSSSNCIYFTWFYLLSGIHMFTIVRYKLNYHSYLYNYSFQKKYVFLATKAQYFFFRSLVYFVNNNRKYRRYNYCCLKKLHSFTYMSRQNLWIYIKSNIFENSPVHVQIYTGLLHNEAQQSNQW